jgi:hypothetical protein
LVLTPPETTVTIPVEEADAPEAVLVALAEVVIEAAAEVIETVPEVVVEPAGSVVVLEPVVLVEVELAAARVELVTAKKEL